jgi:hypothetical protein
VAGRIVILSIAGETVEAKRPWRVYSISIRYLIGR